MRVIAVAEQDPANPVQLDWPHEWRLPVAGEQVDLPELDPYPIPVARVIWVKLEGNFWTCELWFSGAAFSGREP